MTPSSEHVTRSGSHARSRSVSDLSRVSPMPETVNEAIVNGTYDKNLNKETAINRNNASGPVCWGEQPRKSYSLPHRYKAQITGACRALPQDYSAFTTAVVKPSEFKQQFMSMRQWFNRFSDEQKNMVLAELLEHIGPIQLHLLSVAIGGRLHHGCRPNCEDTIGWFPPVLGLTIFSYLDPVSLARASQVCRKWHSLASHDCLWRHLSQQRKWQLSPSSNQKQLSQCTHQDGSVDWKQVWDVEETSQWSSINCKVTMIGHSSTVRCLQVVGERVVSGSYDHLVKVWALSSGECLRTLAGHQEPVLTVAFDDDKIISGAADKTIKFLIYSLHKHPTKSEHQVLTKSFDPQVWQLESGRCQKTLVGHEDGVTTLTFDQTTIISGSLDCTIRLWSLATGQCVGVLDWMSSEGHTGVIRCLAADSRRIVSASDDKTIKVWDRDTCRRLVTLRNHTDGVTCLAFNDHVIVSGSYDKTVKLWDFSVC
ncbi:F-box/WD repeat-containing protein 7 [Portunus trituberculatus]|uniref:F-box/WD repeat-containing protein 7 n=1 Tax=Portunus trituberculatus TaxID=210409 RepID=A0A5B7D881_PORTR|nr:F-box/WD repeat-containing protein 7 [Portunus trituberculatus]